MPFKRVVVIGLDGLEPKITEPLLAAGALPNLAQLRQQGGYQRLRTTFPAQTPVAWSSFATGTNPGGHGIFDFIGRSPQTYAPLLALNRYEQKNAFLPPRAVNLRRGTPVWELLSQAGLASVILRHPCTYPPDNLRGKMLAGVGVPDLRGGLGTSTFYTSGQDAVRQESENVVMVRAEGQTVTTHLIGPRDPRTQTDLSVPITLHLEPAAQKLILRSEGQPKTLEIQLGQWSEWLKVKFKTGPLLSVRGLVRFYLVRLDPVLELFASPVNFDPGQPMFPISSPEEYAGELADALGNFYTLGMAEEHGGVTNGRLSDLAYLEQCQMVMGERERLMLYELERHRSGLFFCLFDTPDRLQHVFWRFREAGHPANRPGDVTAEMKRVVEDHYRACDAIVGKALRAVDEQTLMIVLSDHGMNSFQRGLHLNTWLHAHGLLALQHGLQPGPEAGDFFRAVDWSRTKAYALGLGGIYLNLKGREEQGIVVPDDADSLRSDIIHGLTGLRDPERARPAVRSVVTREQIYRGPFTAEAPDLLVNFAEGYRVSWETPLGGVPAGLFADNRKKWSGDHVIDPALVPGVLFLNRPFRGEAPSLVDLAPTILAACGVPRGPLMEGSSLLP